MSQNPPHVFSGIAPEHFAALSAKAGAAGINIAGDSGSATKHGVQVRWNYDSAARQLTLEVLKTPFFITAADVYARLGALVQQSLA
ncbi:MAG TPA: hypothetical protein VE291_09160 [Terracidiphilus sp.]|jgi:hypothetical protein|nr:hypothetical protein [Terracidiphilus sp.]